MAPVIVKCRCGEQLELEGLPAGRPVHCPRCLALLRPVPDSAAGEQGEAREEQAFEPRRIERVPAGPAGEQWKLTCLCGKRSLSPLQPAHRTGRCPKCGRRLHLPGYRPGGAGQPEGERQAEAPTIAPPPPPPIPKPLGAGAQAAEAEQLAEIVLEPPSAEPAASARPAREHQGGHAAAMHAADRLRSRKVLPAGSSSAGLVSAWPLAGLLPRMLAGFIDLTLGMVATMCVVGLASLGVLPEASRHIAVAPLVFLAAELLNDCVLGLLGGTLGKRLVVLTVRTRGGELPGPARVILRGLLKWPLILGWLVMLAEPSQRALHDLVCGTVVLKGRARGGT